MKKRITQLQESFDMLKIKLLYSVLFAHLAAHLIAQVAQGSTRPVFLAVQQAAELHTINWLHT